MRHAAWQPLIMCSEVKPPFNQVWNDQDDQIEWKYRIRMRLHRIILYAMLYNPLHRIILHTIYRSTPTQLRRPSLPIPRTGCWGSNRLWSLPLTATQGPSHYPPRIFLDHEGLQSSHWRRALSGVPRMRGALPLGLASL